MRAWLTRWADSCRQLQTGADTRRTAADNTRRTGADSCRQLQTTHPRGGVYIRLWSTLGMRQTRHGGIPQFGQCGGWFQGQHLFPPSRTHTHSHTHAHTQAYTHTGIHTHAYTPHTHIHIHTPMYLPRTRSGRSRTRSSSLWSFLSRSRQRPHCTPDR